MKGKKLDNIVRIQ